MADDKAIIIIKKKGGHGGHHGGAWKVAYADFVTAMMAFFMVMWLVNSAETTTKKNIANYFRRPGIFEAGSGTPLMIGEGGILESAPPPVGAERGKKQEATGSSISYKRKSGSDNLDKDKEITYRGEEGKERPLPHASEFSGIDTLKPGDQLMRIRSKEFLEEIAEEIEKQLFSSPELAELLGVVDIKIGADGLTIEIMDTEKASMFASGSARIQPEAEKAFGKITEVLKKLDNTIEILGHTDAKPFSTRQGGYSNWELSSDRANAARRLLEAGGISGDRITSVVGRADKEPRVPEDVFSPQNRRISLRLKFDFSKKVDLSKDPLALDKIPEYQKEHEEKMQKAKEENIRRAEERKTHALTVKELNEKKDNGIIVLPKDYRGKEQELTSSKDKIFSDSPVLGLPNLIYGE